MGRGSPRPSAFPGADARHGERLDGWLARLVELHGRRNVAGSMLGMQIAEVVAGVTVAALTLDRRCPDPAIGNLAVRLHAEGAVVVGRAGARVRRPVR